MQVLEARQKIVCTVKGSWRPRPLGRDPREELLKTAASETTAILVVSWGRDMLQRGLPNTVESSPWLTGRGQGNKLDMEDPGQASRPKVEREGAGCRWCSTSWIRHCLTAVNQFPWNVSGQPPKGQSCRGSRALSVPPGKQSKDLGGDSRKRTSSHILCQRWRRTQEGISKATRQEPRQGDLADEFVTSSWLVWPTWPYTLWK